MHTEISVTVQLATIWQIETLLLDHTRYRRMVKNVDEKCLACRRLFTNKRSPQMIAPLPKSRLQHLYNRAVKALKSIWKVGVDYGGPFICEADHMLAPTLMITLRYLRHRSESSTYFLQTFWIHKFYSRDVFDLLSRFIHLICSRTLDGSNPWFLHEWQLDKLSWCTL